MEKYLELGQIVNTVGLKGEMKIRPFTDDSTRFEELKEVFIEIKNNLETFEIENVRFYKNIVIIKFKGIDSVEEANEYRNCYIKIDRKDAKKLSKGEYFIVDLIGLDVVTDKDILLGNLTDIYNNGSSDIYEIKDKNGKQILLPAISKVIKDINLEKKKITVHLIKGLID